jgi:hypothetical protein
MKYTMFHTTVLRRRKTVIIPIPSPAKAPSPEDSRNSTTLRCTPDASLTGRVVCTFLGTTVFPYTIKDSDGEPIIGRFYEQELYSAEGREPDFKIEKVLRRRTVKGKKMALVKWLGYDNKFNSWIPAGDIKSIT